MKYLLAATVLGMVVLAYSVAYHRGEIAGRNNCAWFARREAEK